MSDKDSVTYVPPNPGTQAAYAGVAMAAAVIISWVAGQFGVTVPGEITAAVSTIIGWAAGKWGT